jgi:hypothetical protein
MPARNSRGIVTIRNVTRTAVAMEQLSKHVSAETNSRNNRRTVFLCGPCWGVTKGTENIVWVGRVSRRQPARIWAWGQRNWTEELGYRNCWVQFSWELNWGTEASELLSAVQWSWIEELRHQNYWVPFSGVELRNWDIRIIECRSVELYW